MTKIKLIENQASGSISTAEDGTFPVVLITPGQGSSGFYHEEIIRDYAPGAFPKGTHVYLDHLKEGETRSPEKLLGTLVEDTVINENGEAVNRFKPLSKHREWVEEVAPIVGLSVSVLGEGRKGEVEGRQTVIVESLEPHVTNSVDLVSYAGRGGKFLESLLLEALEAEERTPADPQTESTKGNATTMELDPKSVAEIAAAIKAVLAEDAAEKEAKAKAEADAAAAAADKSEKTDEEVTAERKELADALVAVESAEIADSTKARLRESLINGESVDVAAAIEAEKKFIEELTASRGVKFTEGFGSSAAGGNSAASSYEVEGW